MDYVYYDMLIEAKTAQENLNSRLSMYVMYYKIVLAARSRKKHFIKLFWDKESKWEQKIYNKLKEWEIRHPILGIIFCTVLGGVLVSLVAGIILEAILMCI